MSESNVETCRAIIEAFNRDGTAGVLPYFAPDAEAYDPDAPNGGGFRGRDAIASFIQQLVEGAEVSARELRFLSAGDRVVGIVQSRRSRSEDGTEVGMVEAHTVTFSDGKIVYWRAYLDPAEALADAGIDPILLEERDPEPTP